MGVKGQEWQEQADARSAQVDLREEADQESFAAWFQERRPHLLKLCTRILNDPDGARDAVSETYLRAYRGLRHFDGINFPGWLSRIAKYVCIDGLRSEFPGPREDAGIEVAAGATDTEMRILTGMQI